MTIYGFNVTFSNPQDQKLLYEYGKEKKVNIEQKERKSNRDESLIKILRSLFIMVSLISTIILSFDPNELFDGLNLILQGNQV